MRLRNGEYCSVLLELSIGDVCKLNLFVTIKLYKLLY